MKLAIDLLPTIIGVVVILLNIVGLVLYFRDN